MKRRFSGRKRAALDGFEQMGGPGEDIQQRYDGDTLVSVYRSGDGTYGWEHVDRATYDMLGGADGFASDIDAYDDYMSRKGARKAHKGELMAKKRSAMRKRARRLRAVMKRAQSDSIEDSYFNEMHVGDVFYEVGTYGGGGPKRIFEDEPYTILSIQDASSDLYDGYDEPSCTVRWNGMEFDLLQSEMDYDGMYISAKALEENRPVDMNGEKIHVGDRILDERWIVDYLDYGGDPDFLDQVDDFNYEVTHITIDGWDFGIYGYDFTDPSNPSWGYTADELRQYCLVEHR